MCGRLPEDQKLHGDQCCSSLFPCVGAKHSAPNFALNRHFFPTSGTILKRRHFVFPLRVHVSGTCLVIPPPFDASRSCEGHQGKQKRIDMIARTRTRTCHVETMLSEYELAPNEPLRVSSFFFFGNASEASSKTSGTTLNRRFFFLFPHLVYKSTAHVTLFHHHMMYHCLGTIMFNTGVVNMLVRES